MENPIEFNLNKVYKIIEEKQANIDVKCTIYLNDKKVDKLYNKNKINKDDESHNEEEILINSNSCPIKIEKIGTSKLRIVCENLNRHFSR
jgi:hypothetical protein